MRRHAGRYVLLILIALVATAVQVRVSADAVSRLALADQRARWPFSREESSQRIIRLEEEARRAGLREGDVLVSVEGRPSRGRSALAREIWDRRAGDRLEVTVVGEAPEAPTRSHTILLAPVRTSPAPPGDWARDLALSVLFPVFCISLGFWVAAVRPFDPLAWLLLVLMISFANFTASPPVHWDGWMRDLGIAWLRFTRGLWPISMLLFGIYFPERFTLDRRLPWLKWVWILPLLGFAFAGAAENVATADHDQAVAWLTGPLASLAGVELGLSMSAIGMFFFALGWKTGTASTPDARRRLLDLHAGTTVSMMPLFVMVIVSLVRGTHITQAMPRGYGIFAILMLLLFPLTLAYVIVVKRALDVRVAIRQGVQYALARGGVLALRIAAGVAILAGMSLLVARPSARRVDILGILGAGVMLLFATGFIGDRLRHWIDRRFFRDAYRADRILTELADKVGSIMETKPLLETVARTLSSTLHVPRIDIFVEADGAFRNACTIGPADDPPEVFPAATVTAERLRRTGHPLRVYFDDPGSWIHRPDGPGAEERDLIGRLGAQLLLPLMVRDRMAGFISMGPKRSEEPYSGTDLRMLHSVATQTAFALEHSRLTEAVAAEAAQRERLTREVEIAREVQRQLFPRRMPAVSGLDCFGTCRPALGVGGDYYDFLPLGDGALGVALGDVAGKGIGAALLMAGLQASLRGQSPRLSGDPGPVLEDINRLIHDSSPDNRYATFFFGRFETATRTLTYVNAGHCPPFILRRATQNPAILRLDEGGTVLGLFPRTRYRAATVRLEPGDLIVGFTDGISEAMNVHDEEWGEERLLEAARACRGRTPEEIAGHLMAAADRFASGAAQHDDMTLVVVQVAMPSGTA